QGIISNQFAALDGLQEGVMQLPSNASALRQTFIEARADGSGNLAHAQTIEGPHQEDTEDDTKHAKPDGLVPCRHDAEIQSRTLRVPNPGVVACNHVKTIFSWTQVA